MRKLILFVATVFSVLSFSACAGFKKDRDEFFSKETLQQSLIPDMPQPNYRNAKKTDEHSFEWTRTMYWEQFEDYFDEYLEIVYDYLLSCNFKYFGYCSFASAAESTTIFNVYPSSSLSDHLYKDLENTYIFAWANELGEGNSVANTLWIEYNVEREYTYSMRFGSELDKYVWVS